ncbi:MAG: CCA tRNA nucleotidyltransferase [Ruminococcus sp.]|nr:CCA tRNA nucleotidyltransferase [Ruminococcus sp.]
MGYSGILRRLNASGYEAYLVGGCVRDTLLGRNIHDFDITTSALPEQVVSVFPDCQIIPTGIKHGTVTLLSGGVSYEITTFRQDGKYSDSRRPDSVTFTPSLSEDLARRDFTMNAIAMDTAGEITDPFGGAEDISRRIIRCVGDPEGRFTEDALRILRAVRFASQLGFTIAPETAEAVHNMKYRLRYVSAERLHEELDKLICGSFCIDILLGYCDVIAEIIPELAPEFGFDQHSPYHCYDVWEHSVRAVAAAPEDDLILRRTMLLHDIAKPVCARFDETGRGHFKRHAEVGADMAEKILNRLRYDKASIALCVTLIRLHSDKILNEYEAKKLISRIGADTFFKLIEVKKCDNLAKNKFVLEENKILDMIAQNVREMIDSGECCTLRQLMASGNDMQSIGLTGAEIGTALDELLDQVMLGELPNDHEALMEYAEKRWKK